MFKHFIWAFFFSLFSITAMATDDIKSLYRPLANPNFDKPYTDFILPLSQIIGTQYPAKSEISYMDYVPSITGLQFNNVFKTPIVDEDKKIVEYKFRTDTNNVKASKNYELKFFLVNNKVEKVLINVFSEYGDQYYLTKPMTSYKDDNEAIDHLNYLKNYLNANGWALDNPIGSFFSNHYAYSKDNVLLMVRDGAFFPLIIDIQRKDLSKERKKFDELDEIHYQMVNQRAEERRKERFTD